MRTFAGPVSLNGSRRQSADQVLHHGVLALLLMRIATALRDDEAAIPRELGHIGQDRAAADPGFTFDENGDSGTVRGSGQGAADRLELGCASLRR